MTLKLKKAIMHNHKTTLLFSRKVYVLSSLPHKGLKGKFKAIVCTGMLCLTTAWCQDICQISSFDEFPWDRLGDKEADEKKIFMFDIDGTLMRTDIWNTTYTVLTSQPYESLTQIWSLLSGGGKRGVLDLGTRYELSTLIDDRFPAALDALRENGHIVWNYTNVYTGKLYDTTYEAQIAYKLDRLKINRSPILVDHEPQERVELALYGENKPALYKGILFNAKKSKSGVFEQSFLPWLRANESYKEISHIVYTDDIAKNVYEIGDVCERHQVKYTGFICAFP
ncbi:DUF2608 domain-containing protein [Candidatus Odyssella thessalonicensis]|uniref:DUF2608 domain-containing protein n=1 Tax=Candidatus Odyssella thessalonicensis TaxID=84647 RepID=UPI000225B214|nr:DUF2608 domain-containing protein [Candidatus Odyssella thessalonicensis]